MNANQNTIKIADGNYANVQPTSATATGAVVNITSGIMPTTAVGAVSASVPVTGVVILTGILLAAIMYALYVAVFLATEVTFCQKTRPIVAYIDVAADLLFIQQLFFVDKTLFWCAFACFVFSCMLNIVYVLYVLNVKAGLIDKSRARGGTREFLYAMLFVLAVTKPDVLVLLPWTAPMEERVYGGLPDKDLLTYLSVSFVEDVLQLIVSVIYISVYSADLVAVLQLTTTALYLMSSMFERVLICSLEDTDAERSYAYAADAKVAPDTDAERSYAYAADAKVAPDDTSTEQQEALKSTGEVGMSPLATTNLQPSAADEGNPVLRDAAKVTPRDDLRSRAKSWAAEQLGNDPSSRSNPQRDGRNLRKAQTSATAKASSSQRLGDHVEAPHSCRSSEE